ncbi:helix-turn-helix domain-containing protein [Endozoicomonas arenosclerae]|uniref:helix-turn-helix domain-containing protein n=1 Tax=Endozoicomonas arenosclerae TaxID=1633495 RepID=UPI0007834514|nr:AraC family transcriptional regulator [Endozoicomonas arenosclerae]
MAIDWFSIALISAISQGFLLCVVILSLNTGQRTANLLLATSVALNTIPIAIYSFIRADIALHTLVYGSLLLTILKAPALYLYVRSLTEADFRLSKDLLKHLLVMVPSTTIFLYLLSGTDLNESMSLYEFFGQLRLPLFNLYVNLVIMAYSITSLIKLERHTRLIESAVSATDSINLNWLKGLIIFMIVICSFHFGLDISHLLGLSPIEPKSIVVLVLNLGFIYFISFGGMRQPIIFTEKLQSILTVSAPEVLIETPSETETQKPDNKYQKSGMEPDRLEKVWSQLTHLLESDRPYLNDELTLPQLAEQLGEKPHDLSQVINSQSGNNFYELINGFRVKEAMELLGNPEHQRRKMLDIATEVGFKSQSTFYNQFKKHAGMTPKQYKDQKLSESMPLANESS